MRVRRKQACDTVKVTITRRAFTEDAVGMILVNEGIQRRTSGRVKRPRDHLFQHTERTMELTLISTS